MGQHYIPKYYLKGFCDSSTENYIWVYEKNNPQVFKRNIDSVASENGRWPLEIEEFLANKVEQPTNFIIDRIRNEEEINQEDKDTLSKYMTAMLQRVPSGLQRAKAIAPTVLDEVFNKLENDIHYLIEKHPSKKNSLQKRLEEIPSLKLKYRNEFPVEIWHKLITPDSLPGVMTILPTMSWIFLKSDNKQAFLTSDNPFFFFEELGINKSDITFPITSDITLWATWNSNSDRRYKRASKSQIKEINKRTVSKATKYIYYSEENKWVVRLMNNKNIKLTLL